MADSFRASFVLALKDDLSSGLRRIIADTTRLRDLAKSLGFKPLEGADAIVNRLDRDVAQLNRDLGTTARQAETAAGAVRRMSAAELGRARQQASQMRESAAIGQRIARGATLEQLYAPGSMPLMSGRERFVPNETGPMSSRSWRGRAGNALSGARERVGALSERIGLVGGAMAGISLMEPIRQAAEFDNVLTHIAITAGATGDQVRIKVAEMAERYRGMALAVQQSSHDVAESAQFLITTGIGEEMTNRLLPLIAKAATAYNTPMRDAVQGAFSMHEELGIAPDQMNGALSAAALAAKQGHFSFSDISAFLPSVAAQAATAGIKGREGLDTLLAALETSRRGAGTSGQAATNLQDFLSYINSPIGSRSFAKGGINLPGLLQGAEKQGTNPLEAVVESVRRRTLGMTEAQSAAYIGQLFHNQEARIFVETMLRELNYFQQVKAKLGSAGESTIDDDYRKAQNMHTELVEMGETATQLNERIGTGFSWTVPVATALMGGVLTTLGWMDHHLPGVANVVFGLTGGMLGLVAVMGVLGTVAGPIKAGAELLKLGAIMRSVFSRSALRLLVNPWLALPLLFAAAVIDIARNWDQFRESFRDAWRGMGEIASGDIWAGAKRTMDATWGKGGIMERLMQDFVGSLPQWGQDLATGLGAAMQAGYAAIGQSLEGWRKLFHDFKPELPTMLPMVPQGGPDSFPKYQPSKPAAPSYEGSPGNSAGRRQPTAYQLEGSGSGAPQVIHVTFTADVPGRASIRHDDGTGQARGPMLSRA